MRRVLAPALAPLLLLPGCRAAPDGVIAPAGPVAAAQFDHLLFILALVLIVVVPVFLFLPWVLWRYRFGRKDAPYRPDWTFSRPLEFLIWGVPVVIVAVLAWQTWHQTHRLDPYRPLDGTAPLRIQAVGLNWKWLFIYPEQDIATVNELVIPQGRDLALQLTADGPMMSFMIPRLGGQIYAMAGMTTQMHLAADREGTFSGLNTQYNGPGFAQQRFRVRSVSEAEFAAWSAQARSRPPLGHAALAQLADPSTVGAPIVFGSVEPGLFQSVVAKYHTGKQAPAMARITEAGQ